MKAWPESPNETVMFSDLTEPLVRAVKFAYKRTRKNLNKDIPYEGYDIGKSLKASCLPPDESLIAQNLKWQQEDQGRDALEVIMGIAVQLGIEQGRRVERENLEMDLRTARVYVDGLHSIFMNRLKLKEE